MRDFSLNHQCHDLRVLVFFVRMFPQFPFIADSSLFESVYSYLCSVYLFRFYCFAPFPRLLGSGSNPAALQSADYFHMAFMSLITSTTALSQSVPFLPCQLLPLPTSLLVLTCLLSSCSRSRRSCSTSFVSEAN